MDETANPDPGEASDPWYVDSEACPHHSNIVFMYLFIIVPF